MKTAGAAGLASVFASAAVKAEPNTTDANDTTKSTEFAQVPRRKLGKTGVSVPCLSLGSNRLDNQIILRSTLKWGVDYWDTANSYMGGESELSIGKYLSGNPQMRKKLFIVSKASGAETLADVEDRFQTSLKRMNTDYIDLYYGVHGMSDPTRLTDELRQWAETKKSNGLIRFFGFSAHKNMAENLAAASKVGWIDAAMVSYNFRLMQDEKIQAGIEACHKAGIGIIAMKTLGRRTDHKVETEEDKKLVDRFLKQGLTEDQAKIKVVLEDERISSACVGMNNVALLAENAAGTIDRTKLAKEDIEALRLYAEKTCTGYCAGCANICDNALPNTPYISDIMRYLMYYNDYGQKQHAKECFSKIPDGVRKKLLNIDYRAAQARCPQRLAISELIAEAVRKLA